MLLRTSPVARLSGLVAIAIASLFCIGVANWPRNSDQEAIEPLLQPLPQDPKLQVYFNHSQANAYLEPYRQQRRLGDDLEHVVIDTIQQAQASVDIAIQELNLPQIAIALRERQQAGVRVRVLVENTYRQPWSQLTPVEVQQLDQRSRSKYQNFVQLVDQNQNGQLEANEVATHDAMAILEQARIPLRDDTADGSKGSDLMHHKFVVVDGRIVISGSANFTWSDLHGDFSNWQSQGNANHLVKIENTAVAQAFSQEFELMWGERSSLFGLKKPYRPPQTIQLSPQSQVTVQFSPTSTGRPWTESVNGLIGRSLQQAQQSVDLALFVFSDQQLSNLLETKHRTGAQIRALIDPSFAYRDYSEALDLLGVGLKNSRCTYEADNRPWKNPIATVGVPQLPEGDLLHHKFAVVDRHLVISGSQNWSEAANRSNDENLLVIDNSMVAAHFEREFDRLYGNAILGVSATVEAKLKQSSCAR